MGRRRRRWPTPNRYQFGRGQSTALFRRVGRKLMQRHGESGAPRRQADVRAGGVDARAVLAGVGRERAVDQLAHLRAFPFLSLSTLWVRPSETRRARMCRSPRTRCRCAAGSARRSIARSPAYFFTRWFNSLMSRSLAARDPRRHADSANNSPTTRMPPMLAVMASSRHNGPVSA